MRVARLEHELGIPVIPCEAANGKGILELRLAMSRTDLPFSRHSWDIPAPIAPAVSELQASLTENDGKQPLIARAEALLLLTDQDAVRVAGSTPLSARRPRSSPAGSSAGTGRASTGPGRSSTAGTRPSRAFAPRWCSAPPDRPVRYRTASTRS